MVCGGALYPPQVYEEQLEGANRPTISLAHHRRAVQEDRYAVRQDIIATALESVATIEAAARGEWEPPGTAGGRGLESAGPAVTEGGMGEGPWPPRLVGSLRGSLGQASSGAAGGGSRGGGAALAPAFLTPPQSGQQPPAPPGTAGILRRGDGGADSSPPRNLLGSAGVAAPAGARRGSFEAGGGGGRLRTSVAFAGVEEGGPQSADGAEDAPRTSSAANWDRDGLGSGGGSQWGGVAARRSSALRRASFRAPPSAGGAGGPLSEPPSSAGAESDTFPTEDPWEGVPRGATARLARSGKRHNFGPYVPPPPPFPGEEDGEEAEAAAEGPENESGEGGSSGRRRPRASGGGSGSGRGGPLAPAATGSALTDLYSHAARARRTSTDNGSSSGGKAALSADQLERIASKVRSNTDLAGLAGGSSPGQEGAAAPEPAKATAAASLAPVSFEEAARLARATAALAAAYASGEAPPDIPEWFGPDGPHPGGPPGGHHVGFAPGASRGPSDDDASEWPPRRAPSAAAYARSFRASNASFRRSSRPLSAVSSSSGGSSAKGLESAVGVRKYTAKYAVQAAKRGTDALDDDTLDQLAPFVKLPSRGASMTASAALLAAEDFEGAATEGLRGSTLFDLLSNVPGGRPPASKAAAAAPTEQPPPPAARPSQLSQLSSAWSSSVSEFSASEYDSIQLDRDTLGWEQRRRLLEERVEQLAEAIAAAASRLEVATTGVLRADMRLTSLFGDVLLFRGLPYVAEFIGKHHTAYAELMLARKAVFSFSSPCVRAPFLRSVQCFPPRFGLFSAHRLRPRRGLPPPLHACD